MTPRLTLVASKATRPYHPDLVTRSEPDLYDELRDLIAILLVAGDGADRRAIERALEITPAQFERVLELARVEPPPGLLIQEHGESVRLVTHPEAAPSVRRFVQSPNAIRLSPAALETLAVIAYSQPTTRGQIQEARGVNSDGPISTLMQHGLIVEAGRADSPGRPTLFETTAECLNLLGVGSLRDLPSLTDQ